MARAMTMGRLAIRNGLSNTKINRSVTIRDKTLRPVMTLNVVAAAFIGELGEARNNRDRNRREGTIFSPIPAA